MVLARESLARTRRGGLRRAWLSADPGLARADGTRRLRGRARQPRPRLPRSASGSAIAICCGLRRDDQGCALVKQGRVADGLRLVDEVLVAATAGELSPIVTGIVYCNTIAFCRDAYELRHAREWTEALGRWCDAQPEMVAHNGLCLVHRAEIMQLRGAWEDAMEEARRAAARFTEGVLNQLACGKAHYRKGEIRRLWGEFDAAEDAYREASRCGVEPQPGLALLRLTQGNGDAAAAAIRRAVGETTQPLKRAALLPAYVEIMLVVGERRAGERWMPRAGGALGATGERRPARDRGTRPGSSRLGRRRRRAGIGRAASRLCLVAGARCALRGRPGAGVDGVCLPGARRRGHRDAGARGRS